MNIAFDKGHLGGQNGVLRMIRDFCTSICGVMHSTREKNTETTWEMKYKRDAFFKSFVTFFVLYNSEKKICKLEHRNKWTG